MYAVTTPGMNAFYFLVDRPEFLVDRPYGGVWEVEENVDIDIPPGVGGWPQGASRPEPVLCRSILDPKHFRLFNYWQEIDNNEFRPAGKCFGGVYSKGAWARFMKLWQADLDREVIPDDDPPGAYEEAMRNLRGSR